MKAIKFVMRENLSCPPFGVVKFAACSTSYYYLKSIGILENATGTRISLLV